MTKYLNYLRVAILCWKQERVIRKCVRECGFNRHVRDYGCHHKKLYNEYEAKISQLTNECMTTKQYIAHEEALQESYQELMPVVGITLLVFLGVIVFAWFIDLMSS